MRSVPEILADIREALKPLPGVQMDHLETLLDELERAARSGLAVCEIPHETIEEEDACEARRLSGAAFGVSEETMQRYSEEYLRRINQGRRP